MESFSQWLSQTWLILAAVIGGITLLWNFINKTMRELKHEMSKPFDEMNAKLDKRFSSIESKIDEKNQTDALVKEALLTMQRKSILVSCEYYMREGWANLNQKETLMSQFDSYKALGGNSFVHEMVAEVQKLPLADEPKKKLNE